MSCGGWRQSSGTRSSSESFAPTLSCGHFCPSCSPSTDASALGASGHSSGTASRTRPISDLIVGVIAALISAISATVGTLILVARYRAETHRVVYGATFWEDARPAGEDSHPKGSIRAWISNFGIDTQILGVEVCVDEICFGMDGVSQPLPYWLRRGEQLSASHSIIDADVTAAAVASHYEGRNIVLRRGATVLFRDGFGHEHIAKLDRASRKRLMEYIKARDAYDARHAVDPEKV